MVEVDEALALLQEKETQVRAACVDFDVAISRLKHNLQLPASMDAWVSSLATCMNFLNKQHRVAVKNELYALSTRMRQVYGQKNAACDVVSLLDARIKQVTELFAAVESSMADCEGLYNQRVGDKTLDVMERVRLRRSMPTLRKGLDKARELRGAIQGIMTEWRGYFLVLAREARTEELSRFLVVLHTHKLTKSAAENVAAPVFERVAQIYTSRDEIVNKSTALGIDYETAWLARGNRGVRPREVRRAVHKYDTLLERAGAERVTQDAVLKEAEDLVELACSPMSMSGPDSSLIYFDRLREGYAQFKHTHVVCDTMEALLRPIHDTLQANIEGLRGDSRAITLGAV